MITWSIQLLILNPQSMSGEPQALKKCSFFFFYLKQADIKTREMFHE